MKNEKDISFDGHCRAYFYAGNGKNVGADKR
jgi:hypothetical protein